jgi:hypothetical protein
MAVIILQDGHPLDRKRRKTWVYAARILKDGSIKIGVSGDLEGRLATVRNDNKSRLELIGIMPAALPDERLLHRRLSGSRADKGFCLGIEYYHDTPEVQAFIRAHLIPAERYGLHLRICQKDYRLAPRPLSAYQPNPGNVSRYMDRILTVDGDDQREVMIKRLLMRVKWMYRDACWPELIAMFRDRLGVDLPRSARTFPDVRTRRIVYCQPAGEVAA